MNSSKLILSLSLWLLLPGSGCRGAQSELPEKSTTPVIISGEQWRSSAQAMVRRQLRARGLSDGRVLKVIRTPPGICSYPLKLLPALTSTAPFQSGTAKLFPSHISWA